MNDLELFSTAFFLAVSKLFRKYRASGMLARAVDSASSLILQENRNTMKIMFNLMATVEIMR